MLFRPTILIENYSRTSVSAFPFIKGSETKAKKKLNNNSLLFKEAREHGSRFDCKDSRNLLAIECITSQSSVKKDKCFSKIFPNIKSSNINEQHPSPTRDTHSNFSEGSPLKNDKLFITKKLYLPSNNFRQKYMSQLKSKKQLIGHFISLNSKADIRLENKTKSNNRNIKVVLSNAVLNQTVKEENYLKDILEEKQRKRRLYLECDWNYHMTGGQSKTNIKIAASSTSDSVPGESANRRAVNNYATDGNIKQIVNNDFDGCNTTCLSNREKLGRVINIPKIKMTSHFKNQSPARVMETKRRSSTAKPSLLQSNSNCHFRNKVNDREITITKMPKVTFTNFKQPNDISQKIEIKDCTSNAINKSMLINKTMLMLPNGKVRRINKFDEDVEASLKLKERAGRF